jgi:DNA-binding transcriptional ArsR family regulator
VSTYAAAIDIDRVFHALSDRTRRKLLELLSAGPATVSKLAEPLGVTLAAVVQHLKVLEESGLVTTQKEGRVRTCHLDAAGLSAVEAWVHERRSLWERRFDRLGDLLDDDG